MARLATISPDGPHLVPFVFAVVGERIVSAVDHKPKKTTDLKRLRNIEDNPRVSILADHYEADWARLWWVRADGIARIVPATERPAAIAALVDRYPQYEERRPEGPVIEIMVNRWSGWTATAL